MDESGNRAVKVPITVGRQNPRQYEIIEGLKAGDRVITSGYDTFGDAEELILNDKRAGRHVETGFVDRLAVALQMDRAVGSDPARALKEGK